MKIFLIFIVPAILLSSCVGWNNNSTANENNKNITQDEVHNTIQNEIENIEKWVESDVIASWNRVYLYSYPYKCEILWTTTYYYPEKAMEFTWFTTSWVSNNTLIRDGLMYSWAIVESANLVAYADVEEDPGVYTDTQMKEMFSDWFNEMVEKMQSQFKDSCEKWDLDESLFEIPTDIDFVEATNS